MVRAVAAFLACASCAFAAGPPVIVVEVASASSFRLGVRFDGWSTAALASPSTAASSPPAPSTPVAWGGMSGLKTSFGALLTDGRSAWALYDAANNTLVSSSGAPVQNNGSANADGGIVLPVAGTSATSGPARQCLGNGMFGPTYYYNRDAGLLAFATSSWQYDPAFHHCYPVSFSGSVGSADSCNPANQQTDVDVEGPQRSSAYPNGLSGQTLATCCAACNGAADCVAFVYSTGADPDPNGNCWPLKGYSATRPNPGRIFGSAAAPPPDEGKGWWAMGGAADWFLAPAPTPLDFTRALYELTGAPAIPPRSAVGFMSTYWGYTSMEEVEGYMVQFRDGAFPIDSFIMDYDCELRKVPAGGYLTPHWRLALRPSLMARGLFLVPARSSLQGGIRRKTRTSISATTRKCSAITRSCIPRAPLFRTRPRAAQCSSLSTFTGTSICVSAAYANRGRTATTI